MAVAGTTTNVGTAAAGGRPSTVAAAGGRPSTVAAAGGRPSTVAAAGGRPSTVTLPRGGEAVASPERARALRAAGIARRLGPAAWRLGGFASSEVVVRLGGHDVRRPAVVVACVDPPVDGLLAAPPLLVVELAPADPRPWLATGVAAVWVVTAGQVECWLPDGTARSVRPPGVLVVPGGADLRVPVAGLL